MALNKSGPRKKPGEDSRDFDTTALKETALKNFVHRDYAAHFFRWGFAERWVANDHSQRILDIGCGPDQAFAKLLCYKRWPRELVSVDYAPVKNTRNTTWHTLLAPFDFTKDWRKIQPGFDVVVCFEVIEHMHKASGLKLLQGARHLMNDDGVFLLSTPVYDGKRHAANHIHEYTIDELAAHIAKAGLRVERRFGTFMDSLKARQMDNPQHRSTWQHLSEYYSADVMSCFLSPLYPDLCRNNLWVLRK